MIDPQFEIEVQVLAQAIDEMDYFQILKVEQDATPAQLKRAYYAESRAFHPDKFFQLPDGELKTGVLKIYKRITEAYTVLRDHEKRAKYQADVNGPDRAEKLRYTEQSEAEQKQEKEEQMGKTPQARQLFRQALLDLQYKRWEQAERNLKSALVYEPDNQLFKEKLEEAQKNIKPKGSGGFAIR